MPKQELTLKIELGGYDPAIISRAFDQITETLNHHFEGRTRNLFFTEEPKSSFDKCRNCVWFHQSTKFCAVAPQNLLSSECGDRQLGKPPNRLNHLEVRSPERIALIQELAKKLEISADELERRLYEGWVKHPGSFGLTTRGLLIEIEKYSGYSISQTELIGDAIRLHMDATVPSLLASAIRKKILAGQSFEEIMYWLLSTNSN